MSTPVFVSLLIGNHASFVCILFHLGTLHTAGMEWRGREAPFLNGPRPPHNSCLDWPRLVFLSLLIHNDASVWFAGLGVNPNS